MSEVAPREEWIDDDEFEKKNPAQGAMADIFVSRIRGLFSEQQQRWPGLQARQMK